jgi:hypothetical protein
MVDAVLPTPVLASRLPPLRLPPAQIKPEREAWIQALGGTRSDGVLLDGSELENGGPEEEEIVDGAESMLSDVAYEAGFLKTAGRCLFPKAMVYHRPIAHQLLGDQY